MFPRCDKAGIEWYRRMPGDPPLADPIGKKPLEPSEREDATLEATDPLTDNKPPH